MKKIAVVGTSLNYVDPYLKVLKFVDNFDKADILLFTGGADVSPSLYNHHKNTITWSNYDRDLQEQEIFNKYKGEKAFLGICRGSQFLTVMNGGTLIQHCNGHAGVIHPIETIDGDEFNITSTHHQMMYPFNLKKDEYSIIAWSKNKLSDYYLYNLDKIDKIGKEPEIVFYPKTNSLAIQGHPEMMNKNEKVIKYINNLILNKLWQM